ncbi:MAG: hypothetical protein GXY34_00130 [Syntrophomonadaceae bacterium]|nr:hypothetical protein [Syntrophomonadaceae bacterium]
MKDYIIWLKSGETISGTMADEEVERLKQWVKSIPQEPGEFNDNEGSLVIMPERVEAVAINDTIVMKQIGY